ncbi:hypothetical protein LSAT2_004740 [Lamellibrachia satsuma]|nr:hypothetical protein LSAT2_004740 [Lamellibrachia satsuma]
MGCCFSSSVENQQEAGTPLEPQSQTSTVPAPSTVPASSPDLPLSTSTTAILVSGIKQTTDEEVLKLFFENRRRSGGGPVQNVDYRKSTGRAVITFYDDKDSKRVLQHGDLSLDNASLTISQVESAALPVSTPTTAILVSGIKQTTDEEVLKLFFQSNRRSGGGLVKNVDYRKSTGQAVITFYNDKVAERVLQHVNLSLDDASLTIGNAPLQRMPKRTRTVFENHISGTVHGASSSFNIDLRDPGERHQADNRRGSAQTVLREQAQIWRRPGAKRRL